jgi:glutaredoxin-like YruB-family protein
MSSLIDDDSRHSIGRHRLAALLVCALTGCALSACDKKSEWSEGDKTPVETAAPATDRHKAEKKSDSIRISKPKPMMGVYKYIDDQGVVNYTDDIRKVPKKYRKLAHHPMGGSYTIYKASPVDDLIEKYDIDADNYKNAPAKENVGVAGGPVVLYSTSWCPYCKRARAYLEQHGVKFQEKDVGQSRAALEEMLKKSGGARGVPVIDVGGKIIRGFNTRALDQALGG